MWVFVSCRLEYEQKRDLQSPMKKLISSLTFLDDELKQVQQKDAEVNEATEKLVKEMDELKNKVDGSH